MCSSRWKQDPTKAAKNVFSSPAPRPANIATESGPSPSSHHSLKATISPSGRARETTKEHSKMDASRKSKEAGPKLVEDKVDAKKKNNIHHKKREKATLDLKMHGKSGKVDIVD